MVSIVGLCTPKRHPRPYTPSPPSPPPPNRSAVCTTPGHSEAATHHPGVICPLPTTASATHHQRHLLRGRSITSISSARQHSSPWQSATAISPWAEETISSGGSWHPSPQQSTGIVSSAGHRPHLPSRAQAPSPQQSTGPISSAGHRPHVLRLSSLRCQALPTTPLGIGGRSHLQDGVRTVHERTSQWRFPT